MTETTESVRQDSSKRGIEKKEIDDWSGRRVVLPRGTTLPATGLPGEVFVLENASGIDDLYIWDDSMNNWVTVGPG